jgi:hypothetical protein
MRLKFLLRKYLDSSKLFIFGLIVILQLFCLVVSSIIFLLSPKLYEANALIDLNSTLVFNTLQISNTKLFIHLQTPEYWIQKLKNPSIYNSQNLDNCSYVRGSNNSRSLSKFIKIKTAKNKSNPSFIELRVFANTSLDASKCLDSIISMIKTEDEFVLRTWIDSRKIQLQKIETRLDNQNKIYDRSLGVQSLAVSIKSYMADERTSLLNSKNILIQEIDFASDHATMKVEKNYLVNPVYPDFKKIIFLGILAGAILSVFYINLGIRNKSYFGISLFIRKRSKVHKEFDGNS